MNTNITAEATDIIASNPAICELLRTAQFSARTLDVDVVNRHPDHFRAVQSAQFYIFPQGTDGHWIVDIMVTKDRWNATNLRPYHHFVYITGCSPSRGCFTLEPVSDFQIDMERPSLMSMWYCTLHNFQDSLTNDKFEWRPEAESDNGPMEISGVPDVATALIEAIYIDAE